MNSSLAIPDWSTAITFQARGRNAADKQLQRCYENYKVAIGMCRIAIEFSNSQF
jgi:hypothetical protein